MRPSTDVIFQHKCISPDQHRCSNRPLHGPHEAATNQHRKTSQQLELERWPAVLRYSKSKQFAKWVAKQASALHPHAEQTYSRGQSRLSSEETDTKRFKSPNVGLYRGNDATLRERLELNALGEHFN